MNSTARNAALTTLSVLMVTAASGNVQHVSAPHLPTTSVHLGAPAGLHPGGSFPSNYAMLTSGLNASFASINQTPMLSNVGVMMPTPMMTMPMNGMMMPTTMVDMPPMAPIAATELSPMATGPIVASMPIPVTPIPMPTMSFMAQSMNGPWGAAMLDDDGLPITNALESTSLFAFSPEKPRVFKEHDLVQIIVRETTRIESFQGLETEKEYGLIAGVEAFPGLNDYDLLKYTGLEAAGEKEFDGEGEYAREDNLTTRLAAEVLKSCPTAIWCSRHGLESRPTTRRCTRTSPASGDPRTSPQPTASCRTRSSISRSRNCTSVRCAMQRTRASSPVCSMRSSRSEPTQHPFNTMSRSK